VGQLLSYGFDRYGSVTLWMFLGIHGYGSVLIGLDTPVFGLDNGCDPYPGVLGLSIGYPR
jgi:hypothetical protein